MGAIYKDSQVTEIDYQYFQINADNTTTGFKNTYFANNIYKVRFMENGAAATDEWKRLDQAYSSIIRLLPVLIDTTTDEYYSFKQHKLIGNINHYIFYNLKYNAETNVITYIEADLNTQDGSTALATKEIPLGGAAVTYLGANGIEINDAAEVNTKTIELEYGKSKEEDYEITVASYLLDITSSSSEYYPYDGNGNDFYEDSHLKIYTLNNENQKVLIEDNPVIYKGTEYGYIGVNINENPYDSTNDTNITTYTTKNETYGISGIFKVNLSDFSISSFYCTNGQTQEKSNVPLIITRLGKTTATIPEKMFPYGKIEDVLIDFTRPPSEINQYSENQTAYIPWLYYTTKDGELTYTQYNSFYTATNTIPWNNNNTFSTNFMYNQEIISYLDYESGQEQVITTQLEIGDNVVDNFILDFLNSNFIQLYKDPSDIASISFSQEGILSLRYFRYNISTSLSDIISTKTWTVVNTNNSNYTALLVLVTYKSGQQYWVPLFKSAEDRVNITLWGVRRPATIKNRIPINYLPLYGDGSKTPSYQDLKDANTILLTGWQISEYLQNQFRGFKPTVEIAYNLTNEGVDSTKPVANSTLYDRFMEVQSSLDQKTSFTDLNNTITNLQIDYQTQVNNKPVIPTAASIQAEMAYDNAPTQGSENLIKSKDLYIVQQNLIEQIGGKTKGYVFDTNAELQAWLTDENKAKLKVGDVLYIKQTGYPDYWWDGTNTQYLETQKVDLTDYYTKNEISTNYATKESLNNYQTVSDRDVDINIKRATITTANQTTLYNTKNSCVEMSLQTERLGSMSDLADSSSNKLSLTILKTYDESNLNSEIYIFTFNQGHRMHSSYLNFLPEGAPEGTYYGSDIIMTIGPYGENNYQQFFIQAWIQYITTANPKIYLKRTDLST